MFRTIKTKEIIETNHLKGAKKRYYILAYYRFVMNEYAKGTLFIFPKPTVRNAKLNEVVFIAHLFTPKGLMISQYSQFLFNQMFEPYSDKEIQEIMNKIKIENKNENQQNHSKKAEKKPFVHLISQSTYDQVFRLKSKLDWNKFNDDIYFNEGL